MVSQEESCNYYYYCFTLCVISSEYICLASFKQNKGNSQRERKNGYEFSLDRFLAALSGEESRKEPKFLGSVKQTAFPLLLGSAQL